MSRRPPRTDVSRAGAPRAAEAQGGGAVWDPAQYLRFRDERSRPFFDLLARVPEDLPGPGEAPPRSSREGPGPDAGRDGARVPAAGERPPVRLVADLGCGTGELTRTLLDRWPGAEIWGVDSSEEMLAKAAALPPSDRLHFVRADLAAWEPPAACDRIVSNAALHWVPDHVRLLPRLAGLLAPGGILAVQMPNNRTERIYGIARELLASPPWAARFPEGLPSAVEPAAWYLDLFPSLGLSVDLWETIYYHGLASADAIVEWIRGSTLRPVLGRLAHPEAEGFLEELRRRARPAYPAGPRGVFFPFRRLFFVAFVADRLPSLGQS